MPHSITKNRNEERTIHNMFHQAFPEQKIISMEELAEGFFNVAYGITLADGTEVIVKIAPSGDRDIMTHEINIMFSEVEVMRRIAKESDVPVADILFYDNSHSICNSDYFIMKKLEGRSFSSCMESMIEEEQNKVFYRMGEYTARINQIKGRVFGYYGQPEKQGKDWFPVFQDMLLDTYRDAERKNIDLKVPREQLLRLLDQDQEIFQQVKEPSLVHWDIWAGNVFVNQGEITGLIDFERCLWADVLMEVGFRTYDYHKAFFDGYGLELDKDQQARAEWYDIYLFLISCLECDYRGYDNRWAYEWGTKMLQEWVEKKESRD